MTEKTMLSNIKVGAKFKSRSSQREIEVVKFLDNEDVMIEYDHSGKKRQQIINAVTIIRNYIPASAQKKVNRVLMKARRSSSMIEVLDRNQTHATIVNVDTNMSRIDDTIRKVERASLIKSYTPVDIH